MGTTVFGSPAGLLLDVWLALPPGCAEAIRTVLLFAAGWVTWSHVRMGWPSGKP